jgi:serine protease DegQ
MEQIIQTGSVTRGWIGVAVQEVTPELAESFRLGNAGGVLIADVVRGSPADQAGIKPGDVLVMIDDKPMPDSTVMLETIAALLPEQLIGAKVIRNQQEVLVRIKIGKRPKQKR